VFRVRSELNFHVLSALNVIFEVLSTTLNRIRIGRIYVSLGMGVSKNFSLHVPSFK
jgi:hypothetical protein